MSSVGRNDPCPCGSGKKYKKCHGMQTPKKFSVQILSGKESSLFSKIRGEEGAFLSRSSLKDRISMGGNFPLKRSEENKEEKNLKSDQNDCS